MPTIPIYTGIFFLILIVGQLVEFWFKTRYDKPRS
jgi:hypothetical protein